MNIGKIKEKALKKLEGNYITPILALLIFELIIGAFIGVSYLIYNKNMSSFFELIIVGLLYMGLLEITIKIARGKKAKLSDLFNRTDLFWKTTAITIIVSTFTLLCIVLEFISFKSLKTFTVYQTDMSPLISGVMLLVGVLLCAAIATFYIVLMISFSQSYYILYDNEDMTVLDILNRSMDLMEIHKLDYIIYMLSFAGWIILGIMTFGLLLFWVAPYIMVSNVLFYDEVVKLEKKEKNEEKKKEK